MKKLLLRLGLFVMAMGLIAAVVAPTVAYFSDSATTTSNAFTAGTLNLYLGGGSQSGDNVVGTWVSPAGWAPGQTTSATLRATNIGSINSQHLYFNLNSQHESNGDSSNLMDVIIVTNLQERFNLVTTPDQAATLAAQVGNKDGVLTLAEFVATAWYTYDDKSEDGIVLGAGNLWDYDLIIGLTFAATAGNEYQGDSCSFDMTVLSTQNSDTTGMISLH
jgi:predicted ribosomally synthesized peptide with SipW-like signal peptide